MARTRLRFTLTVDIITKSGKLKAKVCTALDIMALQLDKELERCKHDFRYFSETYCQIQDRFLNMCLLKLNDRQQVVLDKLESLKTNRRPRKVFVRKTRGLGMSTLACALALHRTMLFDNSDAVIVSYDSAHVSDVLFAVLSTMIRAMPECLPSTTRFSRSKRLIEFKNGSRICGYTASGNGIGLGLRLSFAYLSEISFYKPEKAIELLDSVRCSLVDPESIGIIDNSPVHFEENTFTDVLWRRQVRSGDNAEWYPITI